jgi:hypothetical protein
MTDLSGIGAVLSAAAVTVNTTVRYERITE